MRVPFFISGVITDYAASEALPTDTPAANTP
jgi:hypothetical protein